MRELSLVGLSDDGGHLLARDTSTGEDFAVRADGRLYPVINTVTQILRGPGSGPGTAALAHPSAASGFALNPAMAPTTQDRRPYSEQYTDRHTSQRITNQSTQPPREAAMESILTPREIQSRIRHGESPDDVSAAAGVSRASIEGYIIPVLAEREHVCAKARDTMIRRRHVGGPGMLLGDLVDSSIRARGGKPDQAVWDSWRDDNDGRWVLVISTERQTATFMYDVQDRYILPSDEHARDLVGDIAAPDSTDTALADALDDVSQVDDTHNADSNSVVPASPNPDDSNPDSAAANRINPDNAGGIDPESLATSTAFLERFGDNGVDDDADTPPGVSSLKAARQRRAMEQLALSEEWAPDAPGDGGDASGPPTSSGADVDDGTSSVDVDAASFDDAAVPDSSPATRQSGKRRQERRRVPSWDEIMFGGSSD